MRTLETVLQNPRLRQSAPRLIALWISVAVAIINASPSLVTSKGAATHSDVMFQTTTALPSDSGDNFLTDADSLLRSNSTQHEAQAQSGKKLSTAEASQQINSANEIKTELEWQSRRCAFLQFVTNDQ